MTASVTLAVIDSARIYTQYNSSSKAAAKIAGWGSVITQFPMQCAHSIIYYGFVLFNLSFPMGTNLL